MPDGSLRLFYGVVIPSPGGIRMSSAGPSGTGWTGGGKVSNDNTGGDPGATSDKGGTPIFAWTSGINAYYKIGTNPDVHLGPSPGCCFYDMEAAVDDANGQAFIAYHSNVTGANGLFVRQITPNLGAPQRAPNLLTARNFLAPDHRMPLVARQGGGVYFAYCTGYPRCLQVRLWRVGGRAIVVATGRDIEDVNLARGAEGRLWVMWQDSGRLRATRTNKAATQGRSDSQRVVATGDELALGRLRRRVARLARPIRARVGTRWAGDLAQAGASRPDAPLRGEEGRRDLPRHRRGRSRFRVQR